MTGRGSQLDFLGAPTPFPEGAAARHRARGRSGGIIVVGDRIVLCSGGVGALARDLRQAGAQGAGLLCVVVEEEELAVAV